ncbi:MAG TPA: MerR family transcriptional regulator [Rhodoferax sp.]|nr:MerR family transcriptional regulator [Rhodoferax sp.]
MENSLPLIPAKRYFTIGEVGELCGVKPHVLRYWEQEFTQLRPMKRRGNRRYYQHHEVLMIRRIRDLLYDQGFTISGARNKMQELLQTGTGNHNHNHDDDAGQLDMAAGLPEGDVRLPTGPEADASHDKFAQLDSWRLVRHELHEIRDLLALDF